MCGRVGSHDELPCRRASSMKDRFGRLRSLPASWGGRQGGGVRFWDTRVGPEGLRTVAGPKGKVQPRKTVQRAVPMIDAHHSVVRFVASLCLRAATCCALGVSAWRAAGSAPPNGRGTPRRRWRWPGASRPGGVADLARARCRPTDRAGAARRIAICCCTSLVASEPPKACALECPGKDRCAVRALLL